MVECIMDRKKMDCGGSKGTGSGTIIYSDDGINWFDASNAS